MFKEMFKKIIELLPENIRDNVIFEQVIEALQNELPDEVNFNIVNISVASDIYDALIEDYPDLKEIKTSNNEEQLLNLTLLLNQGLITLKIKDHRFAQNINLKTVDYNGEEKDIELIIIEDRIILDTTEIKEKNDRIIKYIYNTSAYDESGTKIEIDEEKAKDINFSEKFLVPLEDAKYYRTHFNDYIDFLNENRIKEQRRREDLIINDNLFTSPFVLKDLELFIRTSVEEEISTVYEEEKQSIKLTGKLDQIIHGIENAIGESEEIIMSDFLYQALESYFFEVSDILYNKGIIIKRLNGEYILYYIHLENDKIIIGNSQTLKEEEIRKIMDSNPFNYEVRGLREFFGLGLNR